MNKHDRERMWKLRDKQFRRRARYYYWSIYGQYWVQIILALIVLALIFTVMVFS